MTVVQIFASLTLVLMPAYVVRCRFFDFCEQIAPIPLTLLEVSLITTLTSWLVWRVYLLKTNKISILEPFQGLSRVIIITSVLLLLSSLVSVFVSSDIRSAAGIFKAYFLEPAFLALVVFDLSKHSRSISWLIGPLVFSGVWVSLFAVYQHFTGFLVPIHEASRERVSSIYTTSNAIGLYVAPLLFFSLGLVWGSAKKHLFSSRLQTFLIFSVTLFIVAIFFSGSRGAIISSFAVLIFFFAYAFYLTVARRFQNLLNKVFLCLVAGFFVTNIVFIFKIASDHAQFFNNPYLNTINSRFCLWEKSKEILQDSPILGAGLSNFYQVSKNYPVCKTDTAIYPHNVFLNFWIEIGILGLVSFLSLVSFLWIKLNKLKSFTAAGLLAAIVYIFVHGTVDVPYFKNDLSTQFWVLVAVSASVLGGFIDSDPLR